MKRPREQPPEEDLGMECRGCGCRHFWTLDTRKVNKAVRRRRECRNCGRVMTTFERSTGDDTR